MWAQCKSQESLKEGGWKMRVREGDVTPAAEIGVIPLLEEGHEPKNVTVSKSRKRQGLDPLVEPPEGTQPHQHLDFSPGNPLFRLLTSRFVR